MAQLLPEEAACAGRMGAPSLRPLEGRLRRSEKPFAREELSGCSLFDGVELSALWGLFDHCVSFEVRPSEVLIEAGDSAPCLFLLLSGGLEVRVGSPDADAVARIGPGESVGELRLIDRQPASAWVVAREESRVLAVGPEAFWGLVNASHEFTVNLLSLLSRRLRGNNAAVDESRKLQAEYKRHASVDGLTGLYNRRRLTEVLPRYISRAAFEGSRLSVVMTDVDHFKRYNDTFGHAAGDLVLYEVARVLRERCRPSDFVARYGGEEFTLVLPGARSADALVVSDRLRLAVSGLSLRKENGVPLPPVTISLGIAEALPEETMEQVLERADQALYRAKQAGRNRACIHGEAEG